jgi:predicted DNA-binding transcriptional regulator YafY
VSTRTVLRDVDILSSAGIPVYTLQGKGGGIALREGYVLGKTTVTEEEQNQILLALQSNAIAFKTTTAFLEKLKAIFNRPDSDWLETRHSRWGKEKANDEKFCLLKDAILNMNGLSFKYFDSNGVESDREVYPRKIVYKDGSWYIQAWCLTRHSY